MGRDSLIASRSNLSHRCLACGNVGSGCANLVTGEVWCIKTRSADQLPSGWVWLGRLGAGMGSRLRPAGLGQIGGDGPSLADVVSMRASAGKAVAFEGEENWAGPGALPLAVRAKGFEAILGALELSDRHRRKLLQDRCLTGDAVELLMRQGYRSIEHGQCFPGVQAPGFLADGTYTGKSGLLIPARNADGLIVAAQVAPDDVDGGGKYLWVSREDSPIALDGGAWPLFVFYGERVSELVCLVDGALKSSLVGLQQGHPTIGVPGARFVTSGNELIAALKRLFRNPKGNRTVLLMPDAGDTINAGGMPANLISAGQFLQQRGFVVRVAWWGQHSKQDSLDADERMLDGSGAGTETEQLTLSQFADLVETKTGRRPLPEGRSYNNGVNWHKPGSEPVELEFLLPQREAYLFEPGERTKVLQAQLMAGKRFVAETSPTATGKSSYIASTKPSEHGAKQTIWVTRRAIDVAAEFGLPYLRAKDCGRALSEDGRLVRATALTDEGDLVVKPNCVRGGQLSSHLQRGMQMAASTICDGCPEAKTCKSTPGWAKHDRAWVLEQRTFVCEPESLDAALFCNSNGQPWGETSGQEPGTVLFVDETGSMPLFPQTTVSFEDLNNHLYELQDERWADRINGAVLRVLEVLQEEMKREGTVYHCDLLTKMAGVVRDDEICPEDAAEAQLIEEQAMGLKGSKMQSAWLLQLLNAVAGNGQIWIDNGRLCLMEPNQRFRNALLHPAVLQATFFDATGDVAELEAFLRLELPVIAQRAPMEQAEVEIHQWTGLGRLGYTRALSQEKQVNGLLDHLEAKGQVDRNTPIIDTKASTISKGRTRMPITWLGQSRGSNVAKEATALVMIGAPSQNALALLNRYQMLFGGDHRMDDTGTFVRRIMASNRAEEQRAGGYYAETTWENVHGGLRDYVRSKTRADVVQGIGRVRALRRPGEKIVIHYVSDFAVEDLPVVVHDAIEEANLLEACGVTPDVVERAVRKLLKAGRRRVTYKPLAQELQVRVQDIKALANAHPERFGWLLKGQGRPDLSAAELKALEKARQSPPEEQHQLAASEAEYLRRAFPIGTRVHSSFDPSKAGVVTGYCRHRGVPKVQIEMASGVVPLPASLLSLAAVQHPIPAA